MDDKAHILTARLKRNTGVWGMEITAFLAILGQVITAEVIPAGDTSQPVGGWRPLIAAAVAQAAIDQQATPIDEVVFKEVSLVCAV